MDADDMTHFAWTEPVANKRHQCALCFRAILPGERYRRCAGLDDGDAWTSKFCEHCYRCSCVWNLTWGDDAWDDDCIIEWLRDGFPALYSAFQADWRYPDGELVPWPFQKHCLTCATPIDFDARWCPECDWERIQRIDGQLTSLVAQLAR